MTASGLDVSFEELGLARARRQELAAFVTEAKSWAKAQWQEPRAAQLYTERLRALVDFGFVTECYELSEALLASVPLPFAGCAVVRAYMSHAETARKKKLPESRAFYEALQGHSNPIERGHGFAGTSLMALLEGNFQRARFELARAKQAFEEAGEPLDVWKMNIREIMLLRFENNYDAASEACRTLLSALAASPTEVRIDATAVRISVLATLASNALETGRVSEALRLLKGAARLARVLPDAQASVYAFSQYGNALLKAGRPLEAISWLQEASSRQRIVEPAAHLNTQSVLLQCYLEAGQWTSALALAQELLNSRMHGVDPDLREEIETLACSLQAALFLVDASSRLVCPSSLGQSAQSVRAREAFNAACMQIEYAVVKNVAVADAANSTHKPHAREMRLVWDKPNERVVVHHTDGKVEEHEVRADTALEAALDKLIEHAPQGLSFASLFPALSTEHPRSTARRRQRAVKALVEVMRCADRQPGDVLALRDGLCVFVLPQSHSEFVFRSQSKHPEVTL